MQKFSMKANKRLIRNQHKLDIAMRILVRRNGTQCYIENVDRRRKVVKLYMKRYCIQGSIVESYWRSHAGCMLIGKAW